jgi:hypothetical protein
MTTGQTKSGAFLSGVISTSAALHFNPIAALQRPSNCSSAALFLYYQLSPYDARNRRQINAEMMPKGCLYLVLIFEQGGSETVVHAGPVC